ncbi:AAA family ATPase, partial [Pseudonocardia ailaonensis]|uniref:AAA family ATPase n=1 Tax=Pseudonocardia ailaonensis TaxID=367279 RepID=UPI0031D62DC3
MRITGLTLERYGTHEDRVLAPGRGLTLVTGPNEAGKTTLLDAVSDLLWGFPRPVRHAYAASPARLAITASVSSPSGELAVRRTTRGLFAPDETPVEAPWGPGGAQSRRSWQQSFGLGHQALREGGARLCEGDGELAELVFTARSGRDVRAILAELDEEADRLYKEHRNASKVELRRALSAFEHADAAASEQMSRAGDVAALAEEIGRLERRAAGLARDREAAARAVAEAQQRVRAHPAARDVARLRAALAGLAASGVVLDASRLAEFDTARAAREEAENAAEELETRLRALRGERAEILVDEAVTADGDLIRRLEGERQARQADAERLGTLRAETAHRAREAENLLARVEPGVEPRAVRRRLEQLTIPADRAAELAALAGEVERAEAADERAAEQHREARRTVRQAAEGTVGPDTAAVARVAEARRAILAAGSAATLRRLALRESADAALRARSALEGTGIDLPPVGSPTGEGPAGRSNGERRGRGSTGVRPSGSGAAGPRTGTPPPGRSSTGGDGAGPSRVPDRAEAGVPADLVPAPPSPARIAALRTALREAAEAEGQTRREAYRAGRRHHSAQEALAALEALGAPADPAALASARRTRDEAVDALLAAVQGRSAPTGGERSPSERFPPDPSRVRGDHRTVVSTARHDSSASTGSATPDPAPGLASAAAVTRPDAHGGGLSSPDPVTGASPSPTPAAAGVPEPPPHPTSADPAGERSDIDRFPAGLPAPDQSDHGAALARAALAVERAVREADALADGVIAAADRMAELSRARADLAATEEELGAAESAAARSRAGREESRERWIALWAPCPAPHPDEADGVRRGLLDARQALAERDHALARAADLADGEHTQTATLRSALDAAGRPRPTADLDALLVAAADLETEADLARDRRTVLASLRGDAERAARESDARRHDLDAALLRWRHALRAAGSTPDVGPAAWRTRQELLAEAVRAESEARLAGAEAKRLAARVAAHEKAVAQLAERHLARRPSQPAPRPQRSRAAA